jgi:signal transduction histidine kinase
LLSLAAHEFRGPISVVGGYIAMLLRERFGPISEPQRHLLQEARKSTTRLSALTDELSELADLEDGTAKFNRGTVDLAAVLQDAAATLPALADRDVTVKVENDAPGVTVHGDPVRLKAAFGAVLTALRRELVTSTLLLVRLKRAEDGDRGVRISVASDEQIASIDSTGTADLAAFDEWRGGCGMSLAIARRIFAAHCGCVRSPRDNPKGGAVIFLPEA